MSSLSPVAAVLEQLPGVRGWQEDFYRDLHAHPELSHQEYRHSGESRRAAAGSSAARSTRTWAAPASSGCCATATGR